MRKTRLKRTDELLRETIAELILTRLGDPRVGFVSVTGVKISPELDTARVFVTVLGNPAERETAMKGLQSAAPFLQAELNKRVRLRRTPKLRFIYDESVDRGFRIDSALREARESAPAETAGELVESGELEDSPTGEFDPTLEDDAEDER
ncbi:MAG TPA: 30S ribosome-binding factor RbfA [bacterium]|nr:30S ribosome-binding factor RbfA [bacterium]